MHALTHANYKTYVVVLWSHQHQLCATQRTRDQVYIHLPGVLFNGDDEQIFGQLLYHFRNQRVTMDDLLPENLIHCILHKS